MMRYTWLTVLLALFLAAGCSRKATGPVEGTDAAEYAKATKQQVLAFAQVAKENPKSAGGQAEGLLERLQVHPTRPVGDNKPIYEELTKKCKDLVDAAKRSPGSAEVTKLVSEMVDLANKLPG